MKSCLCLVFLYYVINSNTGVSTSTESSCLTIEQKTGSCIPLAECSYLFGLSQQKPLSAENSLYLALSQCGDEGSKVCCDLNFDRVVFLDSTPSPVGERGTAKTESCKTPEGKTGQCVTIELCKPLLDLLKFRPFLPQNQDYLRRSGCGFDGVKAKVCCSTDDEPLVRVGEPKFPTVGLPEGPLTSDFLPDTSVCGITSGTVRITGGEAADLFEFPWMVLLEYETPRGNTFNCGGSLISSRYVLTAAHCIKGKDLPVSWKVVSVRLGEYDLSTDIDCAKDPLSNTNHCSSRPIDVPVVEQIPYEQYSSSSASQHHDIALLRLGRTVTFTDSVKPICLPTLDILNNQYTGENMTVAGWGKIGAGATSNILLKLEITVKSYTDCSIVYGKRINLQGGQFCAGGDRNRDTCKGDSGGPLMVIDKRYGANYYAAGIVSFGPDPCGMENWPGVYTKVLNYVPWIVSKLKP